MLLPQRNQLKVVLLFVGLMWYSIAGYLYFELPNKPDLSWADSIWWTMVTMTTVGYGDYFPETLGGRYLIGIPTMIFGIGFLGFVISELAGRLIEVQSRRLKGLMDVKCKDHILIINFGKEEDIYTLVQELISDVSTQDKEICIIDETLETLPQKFLDQGIHFVRGNPTTEDTLKRANLTKAGHAIILSKDRNNPHSDDQNLATVLVVEKMYPEIFSIVEVIDPAKIRQLELCGSNSVVCVSDLTASLIIQELQDPGVKSVVMNLTSNRYGHQFYILPLHNMKEWRYKELILWGLENRISIVGIMRDDETILNCAAEDEVKQSDKIIVIGEIRLKHIDTTG
ncbi:MAG: hypothetical protein GY765_35215 [bacterium]|nr:hypothetical protein [bacterium]